MDPNLSGILTVALPGAGIGAWYLLKRYNENQPLNEAIDRAQKTAELKKTLEENNYSIEDLREFQEGHMGQSKVAKALSDSFAMEAIRVSEMLLSSAMTQAEMNEAATRALLIADIKLVNRPGFCGGSFV